MLVLERREEKFEDLVFVKYNVKVVVFYYIED